MRKFTFLLLFFIVLIFTASCSLNGSNTSKDHRNQVQKVNSDADPLITYIKLNKLPKIYKPDMARKNGDVVGVHGKVTNILRLDKFIKNINSGITDMVRITVYTDEGDPIIQDMKFENNEVELTVDNTRDMYSTEKERKRKKYIITGILKEENDSGAYYSAKTSKRNIALIFENKKY